MNDDHYLTTAEALAYLHTTQRTLYRRLASGDIPAVRMGHQWRFRKGDLDRWVETQGRPAAAATARVERQPRVLVAEDEPAVRETLTDILELHDLNVTGVGDGPSAIDAVRAAEFDLLITDLRMPGLDGVQVAAEAKRLRPELKVIIVTGYPSQSSAIAAVNLGIDGYLTKPFRPMDVLVAIARALDLGTAVPRPAFVNRTSLGEQ